MKKEIKIIVKKKKKRVPVPQKPPKVEAGKKSYNREEEKNRLRKTITEEE